MIRRITCKWLPVSTRMKYFWATSRAANEDRTTIEFRREKKTWRRVCATWRLVCPCRKAHIDLPSVRVPRQKPDRYFGSRVELCVIGDGTDAQDIPFVRVIIARRVLDELSFASGLLASERVPAVSSYLLCWRQAWRPQDAIIHAGGGKIHGTRVDEEGVLCRDFEGIGEKFRGSIFRHAYDASLDKRLRYSNRIGADDAKDSIGAGQRDDAREYAGK